MFNATVATYWKHLLSLFMIGCIVAFLFFTLLGESLYDFSQQKCWWEISPKSLLSVLLKRKGAWNWPIVVIQGYCFTLLFLTLLPSLLSLSLLALLSLLFFLTNSTNHHPLSKSLRHAIDYSEGFYIVENIALFP